MAQRDPMANKQRFFALLLAAQPQNAGRITQAARDQGVDLPQNSPPRAKQQRGGGAAPVAFANELTSLRGRGPQDWRLQNAQQGLVSHTDQLVAELASGNAGNLDAATQLLGRADVWEQPGMAERRDRLEAALQAAGQARATPSAGEQGALPRADLAALFMTARAAREQQGMRQDPDGALEEDPYPFGRPGIGPGRGL